MYTPALLDPRKGDEAAKHNEAIFASGKVLGIEVTVPALAARCDLGNIDPQHSGGDVSLAAIEAALTCKLPPDGAVLTTIRPDLDSVGAMAVLEIRASGLLEQRHTEDNLWHEAYSGEYDDCPFQNLHDNGFYDVEYSRIVQVAESDRASRGGWPGVRPLPTRDHPWPEDPDETGTTRKLSAIGAAIADFKVSVQQRVEWMLDWILDGKEPAGYRELTENERWQIIAALEKGEIRIRMAAGYRIAVVQSGHRAATMLGYMCAPVVMASNPKFRHQGGEPHLKHTVCQFTPGYADLRALSDRLNELEFGPDWREKVAQATAKGRAMPTWGGSPTIIGSPTGVASTLSTNQVVAETEKSLLK